MKENPILYTILYLLLGIILGLCLGLQITTKRDHKALSQKMDKCLVQVAPQPQAAQEERKGP